MPCTAPGIAAQNSPDTQAHAFANSMNFYRIKKILGTCGTKPTARQGAAYSMENRIDELPVKLDHQANKDFHRPTGYDFFLS